MSKREVSPVANTVRALRLLNGWSAQRLSDEIGGVASRDVIANFEVGRLRDISLSVGVAIAKAFGMSVEQLVGAEVPPEAFVIAREIAGSKERLDRMISGIGGGR